MSSSHFANNRFFLSTNLAHESSLTPTGAPLAAIRACANASWRTLSVAGSASPNAWIDASSETTLAFAASTALSGDLTACTPSLS